KILSGQSSGRSSRSPFLSAPMTSLLLSSAQGSSPKENISCCCGEEEGKNENCLLPFTSFHILRLTQRTTPKLHTSLLNVNFPSWMASGAVHLNGICEEGNAQNAHSRCTRKKGEKGEGESV